MKIRGLCKLPNGKDWLWGQLGLVLVERTMLSKSLIQFSVDGWNFDLSLLVVWPEQQQQYTNNFIYSLYNGENTELGFKNPV